MTERPTPLVTVAIATRNRARYLVESISSTLAQTYQNLEIVVVDDGSTDDTADVVASFGDDRIRYFRVDAGGISAARNYAADVARGELTAVHDDDDLMVPWRLERQVAALTPEVVGTYGSFVNFDDGTGAMKLVATPRTSPRAIDRTGAAPGHGTWLVRTEAIRRLRYDEALTSGVDNNLALRMVRSGLDFIHTGEILMLRRVHAHQATVSDGGRQARSARMSRLMFSFTITDDHRERMSAQGGSDYVPIVERAWLPDLLTPYLPDHLVRRSAWFFSDEPVTGTAQYAMLERDGRPPRHVHHVDNPTWRDLAAWRARPGRLFVDAVSAGAEPPSDESQEAAFLTCALQDQLPQGGAVPRELAAYRGDRRLDAARVHSSFAVVRDSARVVYSWLASGGSPGPDADEKPLTVLAPIRDHDDPAQPSEGGEEGDA